MNTIDNTTITLKADFSTSFTIYLAEDLLNRINETLVLQYPKIAILTEDNIPSIYLETLKKQLPQALDIIIPSGEEAKNLISYQKVVNFLLENDFNRDDLLINLGGGMICDLGGFVAATYKRGMNFLSIPTTTLSQIDACVGGKVAINHQNVKNLLGTFYHPVAVIIDTSTTKTLTTRHFYNGLYEALKMGLLFDQELVDYLQKDDPTQHLVEIIKISLKHKIRIVKADEQDNSIRHSLNYGHTIGHAIESLNNYKHYLHGEAIMYGMIAMLDNPEIKESLQRIAQAWKLPSFITFNSDELIKLISKDKKASSDKIACIILNNYQDWQIKNLSLAEIKKRMIL